MIDGLDKFNNTINKLTKNLEKLDGKQNVPLNELLSTRFISQYTQYADAEEMFIASGFKVENQSDLEAIPDDEWDNFISSNSSFDNWSDMLKKAAGEWALKKLDLT